MSTLKADAVTTKSNDTDLTLTGGGTGVPNLEAGFKVGGSAGVPTASIQDDAVTLAKLASGTDGELITWDASGDPAVVAVGTATHVLTSTGAGAAPTFQAAAGGGSWNIIGTVEASDDQNLTVTGLDGTYDTYAIGFSSLRPTVDQRLPQIRIGTSGGIETGGSDYPYVQINCTSEDTTLAAVGTGVGGGASRWVLSGTEGCGNATGEAFSGLFYLTRGTGDSSFPRFWGQGTFTTHETYTNSITFSGSFTGSSNIDIDRVQFYFNTGDNIVSGRMTVWGIAHA